MAQYLFSVLTDSTELATEQEMASIDVFNEQLQAGGHWVFAGGLTAPGTAVVVDGRAPDLDAARQLAALGSKHCNRRVELRPFAV